MYHGTYMILNPKIVKNNSHGVECCNLLHPLFVVAALLQLFNHLRKGVGTGEDATVGNLGKRVNQIESLSMVYDS